jgi:C1A family cysteine protease
MALFSFLFILAISFSKYAFVTDQTLLLPVFSDNAPRIYGLAENSNYSYGLGCIPEKIPEELRAKPMRMALGLPQSFDWTQQSGYDWMTSVKNQLSCGSCVAFGSIAAFEGQIRVQANSASWSMDLSEQHLFSCGGGSCSSGWTISAALNYLKQSGTPDESCFPYQAKDSTTLPCSNTCSDWQSRAYKISSWHWTTSDPSDIQATLLGGPLVASFEVFADFYYSYTGGVYHHTWGGSIGWHCITIVGYDSVQRYWKCKNSWGASWGESGYFRIGFGECSIQDSVASFQAAINTVTFYTDPSSVGSISADGAAKTNGATSAYRSSTRVHIVATPATGYIFLNWETNGISVDNQFSQDTYMTVSGNGWLEAHFTNVYQITITSEPTGSGYVTVDGNAITTPQTFIWIQGSTHTLVANSPVSGGTGIQYVWLSWSDSGSQSHTITVPSSPATYTATFKKQYMLTLSVNPSSGGVLSVGSGWRDDAAVVPVTATANSGYSFYYWSLDGVNVGINPSYSVLMSSAHSLTAFFRSTSSVSLGLSAGSIALGASVTISGAITPTQPSPGIPMGTTVTLTYSLDGVTWNTFITTKTNSGGAYSIAWYPPYPSAYQIKTSWTGDSNYEGSTSSTVSLTVTGTFKRVTLLVSGPDSTTRGSSATFDVLLNNTDSPLTTTLYFEVTGPGGYWYFDAKNITVTTSGRGRFQFTWQVPSTASTGQYEVFVGLIPPKPTAIAQTQITVQQS